jgi:DNA-binding transcriptional LysR family regulator
MDAHRHFDPVTLRLFVLVCEERNISRAAAREAMVPSAVSKRIGACERMLGTPLLVRSRRGIEPTAAGQVMLRRARELLGAMARMHAELDAFASGVHGSVRVVASVSALAEALPGDVAAFVERHQSVRVSLDERISIDVVSEVREGAADVGVAWDQVDAGDLRAVAYRSDHLHVLMLPSHPLAAKRSIRFAQTLEHPSVGVSPGGLLDTLVRRQAALLGRTPNYRMQVSSLDAGARIVAAGMGLAIIPGEAAAPQVAASGLVMVPLADAWSERRFVVLCRADAMTSVATRQLIEHLAACAATT